MGQPDWSKIKFENYPDWKKKEMGIQAEEIINKLEAEKEDFTCAACGKICKSELELNSHTRTHNKLR